MNDLISRATAIEALSTPCDKRYRHGVWETCLDNIETAIRNIPTVDAAPVVHGRWGENGDCSECGFQPWYERDIHTLLYCPNCGAKMDGDGDG